MKTAEFVVSEGLYQYTIAMINLVLDDLRGPAGEGFDPNLELLVLPLHLDGLIALAGAGAAEKGKATLFGVIETR